MSLYITKVPEETKRMAKCIKQPQRLWTSYGITNTLEPGVQNWWIRGPPPPTHTHTHTEWLTESWRNVSTRQGVGLQQVTGEKGGKQLRLIVFPSMSDRRSCGGRMHFTRDGHLTFLPTHSQLADVSCVNSIKDPKASFALIFSHSLHLPPPLLVCVGNCFAALDGVLLYPQLMHS